MKRLIGILGVLALGALCVNATCNSSRTYKMGISGLVPAHWPNPTPQDWTDFATQIKADADHLGVHVAWQDVSNLNYAQANNINISVVLGVTSSDMTNVAAIQQVVAQYAASPLVKYLCFGNEIEGDPNFPVLASLINNLVSAAHSVNGALQTCTVFQYERALNRSDNADHISSLNVDFMGFTTYPVLKGYTTVASVPTNYYSTIGSWTSKPIAITEVAWPSVSYPALGNSPAIPASEAEQKAFMQKLPTMLPTTTKFVNWFTLNDLAIRTSTTPYTDFSQLFDTMALRNNSGSAKQAFQTWLNFLALPYSGS